MQIMKDRIAEYLNHCRTVRRLSDHTLSAYEIDLLQFYAAIQGSETLTAEMVRAFLTSLAQGTRYSAATIKRKLAAIRAFLKATDESLAIQTFGTWRLKVKTPVRLPKAVPKSELANLLKFIRTTEAQELEVDETTYVCLSLLTATGLRVSELCSLRDTDVRPDTGEIEVFGKGARERIVIVANLRVRNLLKRYVQSRGRHKDVSGPLFSNRRGRPLTPQCLRLRLHSLVRKSPLSRRVTPHMLRHTAATLLLEGGVDIRFVQRLLGHASIATTQIYTHVSDGALRGALERADVMRALI
jgi:integrase/recombinase XerD